MRILFILPDVDSFHKLYIHFGIAYISGFLKKNGYDDIRFLTVTSVDDYKGVVNEAVSFKPDIVGFTSVETQFSNVINLSKLIKEVWKCVIVCGGSFATLYPDCIKDAPHLDGVFIGESEGAFLKLVKTVEQGKDFHAIENFYFYDGNEGRVVKNNLLPKETDLDRLGFPDRSIFNFQKVIDSYGGAAPFMLNRGCPYNCTFCSNHALAYVYGSLSNLTRMRSVDSSIEEIKDVNERYKFDVVHIWDDIFITNRKWLCEFLDKYKSKIKKPFMCTTRSNLCDDELFKKLKEGGCYRVHMSLESGNDFIRNTVMKRNISRDIVIKSFELAHKYGIQVNASSIIGLPFETKEMIKETISLIASLKIESCGVNVFYPYRGTHLRDVCMEYGLIERGINYGIRERKESILKLPHITKEELQYHYDNFEELVRKKEGFIPYIKYKLKKTAKTILPQQIQDKIRAMRKKNIVAQNFPSHLLD